MKVLEITSYIGCINHCRYCPQDVLINSYKDITSMSLDSFKTLLINVPKDVRIDFSGFSEIFGHRDGANMIRYAFDQGYEIVLYTTFNGITAEDIDTLIGVRFKEVSFHHYDGVNEEHFYYWSDIFRTVIQEGRVISDIISNPWSRAGSLYSYGFKQGEFSCRSANRDFDHNVLLPNGDVYLCCMDYSLKHRLGSLFDTHYGDLNRYAIVEASKCENSFMICRQCELFNKQ